jgi:hypothetical protein
MSTRRHIGFGSTPSFSNLYNDVKKLTDRNGRLAYANYDPTLGEPPTPAQIELLQNYKVDMPTLTFTGSEKLHGENMAVCLSNGELWVQGRNHVRTLLGDQNGMAQFVEDTKDEWVDLLYQLANTWDTDVTTHTIVIDCEWAGANIQKGNAACSGTPKGAYIFDYCRIVNNENNESEYKRTDTLSTPEDIPIYLMSDFTKYEITLDFNNQDKCEQLLADLALQIENNSPIAKFFDKPDNVGEGVYLWSTYNNEVLRLKAKGEKHGGKPKEKKPNGHTLSDSKKEELAILADKLTPVWRINQAITETEATEKKHIGKILEWIKNDILKEEIQTLESTQTELKQVQGFIVEIVKNYYFNSLKDY